MSRSNYAISVSALKKSYHEKEVLKNVSFSVPPGTIYALLGSNGAGKTTTIRILTTQILADSGNAAVAGYDVMRDPEKVREAISLTGQFSAVDEALTGKENLIIMGRLRHIPAPEKTADELLKAFGLTASAEKTAALYSGGMKRKLDIAMSLIGNPRVIFLDEPTTGLDPQSRRSMWEIIRTLKESGVTIFLTTQYLEEAEQLADQIAILDRGILIAEGTADELKSGLAHGAARFLFEDAETRKRAAALLPYCRCSFDPEESGLTVFTDGTADALARIFHTLYQNRIRICHFSEITPDLEDVFFTMITKKEEHNETPNQKSL